MPIAAPITSLPTSLSLAVRAGLVLGAFLGLVDGCFAAAFGSAALGPGSLAGCLAASVFEYSALCIVVFGVLAIVLNPALGRWSALARLQALLALGLAAGVFVELYWRTRPWVFYGHKVLSPERILAAVGFLVVALLVARLVARPVARLVDAAGWKLALPLAAIALTGGTYVVSQRDVLAGHGVPNERTRDLPNVLLVVVDALRQDTLGCYGHPRVKTPHIDRLAREGVLFENAFTQAPFTWSSFGSLLTGKYPRRHGLVKMVSGRRMVPNVTLASHLESARRTDGATLRDSDLLSVSFHTGTLSTGSGLLQGFDLYYEQLVGHGLVTAESAWSVFRSDLLLHLLRAKFAQRTGGDVAGVAREWLGEHGRERFLAMVHLYSTHTPYDPPEEFRKLYVDPAYAGPLSVVYQTHTEALDHDKYQPTDADLAQLANLYYAGVTQADASIGALLAELERQGTLDDTLVIVTADHGESLGEKWLGGKRLWEHNHMVQTNLRVPLVMRWPRGLPAGKRVSAITDEIDVFPTVCDLARLELPAGGDVYSKIDGQSLLPLVRGEAATVREFSLAENPVFVSIQDPRWKLIVPFEMLEPEGWAKGKDSKVFPQPFLFDLEKDPAEQRSVLEEHPDQADRLVLAARAWNRAMPVPRMDLSPRDLDEIKRMAELGYAGGVGAEPADGSSTPKRP